MLWIKAFHLVVMVIWFSGLFYLPRLFVYHAASRDTKVNERFLFMEKKLYYCIMHPGAALTICLGSILLYLHNSTILHALWLQIKLGLVLLLLLYHFYLGYLLQKFARNHNTHTAIFYRWLNEIPTFFLISIVLLVLIQPQL